MRTPEHECVVKTLRWLSKEALYFRGVWRSYGPKSDVFLRAAALDSANTTALRHLARNWRQRNAAK